MVEKVFLPLIYIEELILVQLVREWTLWVCTPTTQV
jgi:hypothetical protein